MTYLSRQRTYSKLPGIVSGYPIDERWSIVVPVARTNEITNPSLETGTTGYTAGAGTLSRTTAQQYHGAYSLIYTPSAATTDGCYYTITTTLATRAISCKFLGDAGLSYTFSIATTGAVDLQTYTFTATGRWQWLYFYYTETSATTRRIYWRKNGSSNVRPFYVDGVQVEAIASGETVSTYIDGDQQGLVPNQFPPAYLWTGTPHASTSTRSGLTRAGGMVVPFSKYGFLLTAIVGLGLAIPQNVATDYARIDGGYDDYTRKPSRQVSLVGTFESQAGYLSLRQQRGGLARLFDRDLVAQDQRLVLLREALNDCGAVDSTMCRLIAKYAGGLDGNTDNHYAEAASINLTNYLPLIVADGSQGTALTVQQSVTNINNIALRSASGNWQAIGTGASGGSFIQALLFAGGKLYIGGDFTSFNGVANTRGIAVYDLVTGTVSALGTGAAASSTIFSLTVAPNGDIIAGGSFSSMGGVANTLNIARWDGSAWNALSTGANNIVADTAYGPDGSLYICGSFTSAGGTAASKIAKWNGSAFSALGSGASAGDVLTLSVGKDGYLYAGGGFASMGGAASTQYIARWNLSTSAWSTVGGGASSGTAGVSASTIGLNGLLYIGGDFTTVGGVALNYFAVWNGTAWSPIPSATALNGAIAQSGLTTLINGNIALGGGFTTANGVTLPDKMTIWNGATYLPFDIDLPGTTTVFQIAQAASGELALGYNSTGTATAAGITTATNGGSDRAYPILTIRGPSSGSSRIYQLVNFTTGRAVYLNYTINAGETARFVFTPDNLSFTSTFQGNIASTILPGSNEADFYLQPGANSISFFAAGSTVTATLEWQPAYASIDDVP